MGSSQSTGKAGGGQPTPARPAPQSSSQLFFGGFSGPPPPVSLFQALFLHLEGRREDARSISSSYLPEAAGGTQGCSWGLDPLNFHSASALRSRWHETPSVSSLAFSAAYCVPGARESDYNLMKPVGLALRSVGDVRWEGAIRIQEWGSTQRDFTPDPGGI